MIDMSSTIDEVIKLATEAAENANSVVKEKQISDPEKMLRMQFEMQHYSNYINYGSSFIKTVRDMVSGIIAKV